MAAVVESSHPEGSSVSPFHGPIAPVDIDLNEIRNGQPVVRGRLGLGCNGTVTFSPEERLECFGSPVSLRPRDETLLARHGAREALVVGRAADAVWLPGSNTLLIKVAGLLVLCGVDRVRASRTPDGGADGGGAELANASGSLPSARAAEPQTLDRSLSELSPQAAC